MPEIDDGLVFVVHRVRRGKKKFLLGFVVEIDAPGETARTDRTHETFLDAGRGHRFFQVVDVGLKR